MSNSKAEWLQGTYGKAIERAKERQKVFETTGKMPIEPVYAAEDLRDFDPDEFVDALFAQDSN